MASQAHCRRALDLFEGQLSSLKNVVGLGIVDAEETAAKAGAKECAVAVYVSKKLPAKELPAKDRVPPLLELNLRGQVVKVPTQVIEQGEMSLE